VLDVAREHGARIVDVMHDVPGLQMYSISGDPTSSTSVTITVCADKTGTDESIKRAAALVKELLPNANIAPPRVLSGELALRLAAKDVASRTGNPHLCCVCTPRRYPGVWRSTRPTSSRRSAPFPDGVSTPRSQTRRRVTGSP
jgi:hypothetical protein